jgi:hypothetical protein
MPRVPLRSHAPRGRWLSMGGTPCSAIVQAADPARTCCNCCQVGCWSLACAVSEQHLSLRSTRWQGPLQSCS